MAATILPPVIANARAEYRGLHISIMGAKLVDDYYISLSILMLVAWRVMGAQIGPLLRQLTVLVSH